MHSALLSSLLTLCNWVRGGSRCKNLALLYYRGVRLYNSGVIKLGNMVEMDVDPNDPILSEEEIAEEQWMLAHELDEAWITWNVTQAQMELEGAWPIPDDYVWPVDPEDANPVVPDWMTEYDPEDPVEGVPIPTTTVSVPTPVPTSTKTEAVPTTLTTTTASTTKTCVACATKPTETAQV